MSAKVFLDTNVVAYAFDPAAPAKRQRSRDIMAGHDWVVSWQVVQEFSNLALHRFAVAMKPEDLADYLEWVLWPRCVVLPSLNLYRAAATLHGQTQYRFYDSLVVAAALASGAALLLTEDLQHGRAIGSLTIENPFAAGS
ncbi:MAG: PIN domain-containing protein [Verrucomicrobiota bacterium]